MEEVISVLLQSVKQVHIYHLQTNSYAEHMALGSYYEDVQGIIDALAEAYQGKYGIMKYKSFGQNNYESKEQVIKYFEDLVKLVVEKGHGEDGFVNNYIDEIEGLIYSTIYKLKYLQ